MRIVVMIRHDDFTQRLIVNLEPGQQAEYESKGDDFASLLTISVVPEESLEGVMPE